MKRCTLYTCFICGIIRSLILRAIVHKKENHGSIVVGQSRKFTSLFLTKTAPKIDPEEKISNFKGAQGNGDHSILREYFPQRSRRLGSLEHPIRIQSDFH